MNKIALVRGQHQKLVIENPAGGDLTLVLADGAALWLDIVEDSPTASYDLSINASLGADTSLNLSFATINGREVNTMVNVDLNGPGSKVEINGLVLANDRQKVSYTTKIAHHCEHSSSNQLFKYVADGNSRCSFNGRIIVDQEARFTEAFQTNRNLLASADAQMHAEPTLEIYCDEVKCSHGAATGQLDDNALFYMRQRGIPLETARRMLMQAFVADVADRISDRQLRDSILNRIDHRFSDF